MGAIVRQHWIQYSIYEGPIWSSHCLTASTAAGWWWALSSLHDIDSLIIDMEVVVVLSSQLRLFKVLYKKALNPAAVDCS